MSTRIRPGYTGVEVSLSMGRASDNYYVSMRVGGARGQRVMLDLSAEQFAQLVTGMQVETTAEVRILQ